MIALDNLATIIAINYQRNTGNVVLQVQLLVQTRPYMVEVIALDADLQAMAVARGDHDWGDADCVAAASAVLGIPVS